MSRRDGSEVAFNNYKRIKNEITIGGTSIIIRAQCLAPINNIHTLPRDGAMNDAVSGVLLAFFISGQPHLIV